MYEGEYIPDSVYDRLKERVRKDTPTGLEAPRFTKVEIMLCEYIGDLERRINVMQDTIQNFHASRFPE